MVCSSVDLPLLCSPTTAKPGSFTAFTQGLIALISLPIELLLYSSKNPSLDSPAVLGLILVICLSPDHGGHSQSTPIQGKHCK